VLTRALVLSSCLVVTAVLVGRAADSEPVPVRESLSSFPQTIDRWQGRANEPFDERVLAVLKVDDYLNRVYVDNAGGLGLYIGYWASQREGDTMHSPLNCLPGAGWEPTGRRTLSLPGNMAVNRLVVQKGLDRQLVVYWYQSHGRVVASEYWVKAYTVADAIRLHRTDAAIVRVVVPVVSASPADEARAEASATRFVEALVPHLSRYLPE
jgi:EpsI family protein